MTQRPALANTRQVQDAEALLAHGDYRLASAKLWDAVAIAVKATAGDWTAEGHRDIRRLVEALYQQSGDRDLLRLFTVVESLGANGRENFMSGDVVKAYAEDARAFLERLATLPEGPAPGIAGPADPADAAAAQLEQRRGEMRQRLVGLSRKAARREILRELVRTGEQIQATGGRQKTEGAVPGFTAARIAGLMRGLEAASPANPVATDLLGRYQSWLLELLVARGEGGPDALQG